MSKEIESTIKSYQQRKIPGPDGFTNDLKNKCQSFFEEEKIL